MRTLPDNEKIKAAARRAGIDVDAPWRYSETSAVGDRPWLWAQEWRRVRKELERSRISKPFDE